MHPETLPPVISNIELRDSDGNTRRLGEAWQSRPAVIAFVRHFG